MIQKQVMLQAIKRAGRQFVTSQIGAEIVNLIIDEGINRLKRLRVRSGSGHRRKNAHSDRTKQLS